MSIQRELAKKFEEYHQDHRYTASCNMAQIAKEMNMPRLKLYRWIKGKARLNEAQIEYIQKFLDKLVVFTMIIPMIHSCLYYIASQPTGNWLRTKFFKARFVLKTNLAFFIFKTETTISKILANSNRLAFLFL